MLVAQAKFERAEEALADEWREDHPAGKHGQLVRFLASEPALLPLREGLARKEAYLIELTKKLPVASTYRDTSNLSALKRVSDTAASSSSSSGSKRSRSTTTRESNAPFRERIMERDGDLCVACRHDRGDACHIVPHRHQKRNLLLWAPGSIFYNSCSEPLAGINDVRNGMFLCRNDHDKFDFHPMWTIATENGQYFYTTYSLAEGLIRGRELFFGGDAAIRPHPEFLAFQYKEFVNYHKILAAGHKPYTNQNSEATLEDYHEKSRMLDEKLQEDENSMLKIQKECFLSLDEDEKNWLVLHVQ
ncbi:hypothetical protein BDR26DRAFT_860108 [Obelidium mucronatum]|nr:hypothetical protein BDR26DRAFT_860108 [Obelidium mucronatum]